MTIAQRQQRTDWRTAQVVDDAILFLGAGGRVSQALRYMSERFVPPSVQQRVLSNQAVLRQRDRAALHPGVLQAFSARHLH